MASRSKRVGTPFSKRHGARPVRGEILMDDRTRSRLARIRWRRIFGAMMLAAITAGAVAIYLSPITRVQNTEVTGATTVGAAEIESLAGLDGESMLRLDTAGAEARIEELPFVKEATITRSWPQTVRVAIVERTPWAVWQAGGLSYVVDDEGVVMPVGTPGTGLPAIIVAGAPVDLTPGQHVDGDAVAFASALMQQVPEQLALSVSSFEWSDQSGLKITTDAGYSVVLGDSENMDYKLAVWREIEAQLGRESMSGHVLDLRFGDRPSFQ
ncbi:MAG: FtsQ-type POTRA domain-containing protein [Dehalococcoidia bacterium]